MGATNSPSTAAVDPLLIATRDPVAAPPLGSCAHVGATNPPGTAAASRGAANSEPGHRTQIGMMNAPLVRTPVSAGVGDTAHGVAASGALPAGEPARTKLDVAVLRTQTKLALTGLGWQPAVASTAIAAALATLGTQVSLEQLIYESLRRCPRPRA